MNAIVFAKGCEVRASSRDVADAFEKEHRTVLRSIDALIAQEPSLAVAQFCAAVFRQDGVAGREHRYFEMTRDGFSLLAMGFTGPKALKWKLAFIDAFNRMEEALRDVANDDDDRDDDDRAILPGSLGEERLKVMKVREARLAFGPAAARRMWKLIGLEDVAEPEPAPLPNRLRAASLYDSINRWVEDRTEVQRLSRTPVRALWEDYMGWCRVNHQDAATRELLMRFLTAIGCPSVKTSKVSYRLGIRLKPT